jgi:hypothetical protein
MTKYQATKALISAARDYQKQSDLRFEMAGCAYPEDVDALIYKGEYFARRAHWAYLAAARVWQAK